MQTAKYYNRKGDSLGLDTEDLALTISDSFCQDIFERISAEAEKLAKVRGKVTVTSVNSASKVFWFLAWSPEIAEE